MLRPLRYAVRSLLGSPGFTTIALLTLALAIGVNSSMYTLMKTLLFTNAPFPRAEEVFDLRARTPSQEFINFSKMELDDLRGFSNPAVKVTSAYASVMEGVSLPGQLADQMQGVEADANLFQVTEVSPLLGRAFTAEECIEGRDTVVLITEKLWIDSFGRNPDVLGQSLRINGRLFSIIGVVPNAYRSQFIFGSEALYLRPMVHSADQANNRERRGYAYMVRLQPTASAPQALGHYERIIEPWRTAFPKLYENYSFWILQTGRVPGEANEILSFLLLGLALSILAIACANLANLQMARANARLRDLAIRSALGASRLDLIKHQLVESILLSVTGGTLGLLVATWSNELIGSNIRIGFSGTLPLSVDGEVILFNGLASLIAGVGFGLVPAWLASRTDVNDALKSNARGSTGGKSHGWVRRILVIAQVALSLALLSVAGMMVIGLRTVLNERPSWDSEKLLTANVQISETTYPDQASRRAFHDALLARLKTIPGIEYAALSSMLPTGGGGRPQTVLAEQHDASATELPSANVFLVTGDYFATLGIRLLEGRTFASPLPADTPDQVLVNRALAEAFWPKESAVGKRLGTRGNDGVVAWREVIGVVSDAEDAIRITSPRTRYQFYTALSLEPWTWFQIALRGENPMRFANDLRRAVTEVSPEVAPRMIWTIAEMRELFLHNMAIVNGVVLAFALLGLVIASVGLAGVVAQSVNQRLGEFGIRLALGAMPSDLMKLVMRQALLLTTIGLLIGLALGIIVARGFPSDLSRLIAINPLLLFVTTAVIAVVSLLASWLPARRATTADPMSALRSE